jgi:hypothetical protein
VTAAEIADELVRQLRELDAYVYSSAVSGASYYVKFPDAHVGSVRISDHPGRKKYKYRWNVLVDDPQARFTRRHGRVLRFYYGVDRLDELVTAIKAQAYARPPQWLRDVVAEADARFMGLTSSAEG